MPTVVNIRRKFSPRWRNCGASAQQNQLATEQANFYQTLTQEYQQNYGEQQDILSALTAQFKPILAAGPEQYGFAPAEDAALRTQAQEGTARGANNAAVALANENSAAGGGNEFLPSGVQSEEKAQLLESAAEQNAGEQEQITEAGYQQGEENFTQAENALAGTAQIENPTGYAGVATGAGSAANTTMNDIAQENAAWMAPVFGLLGGVAGAVAGH